MRRGAVRVSGAPRVLFAVARVFLIAVFLLPAFAEAEVQLPEAIVGRAYRVALPVRGGEGAMQWKSTGGLPPGLRLGDEGILTGIPTTAGEFEFSVTVMDEVGGKTPATRHRLRVLEAPPTPVPLGIPWSTLPEAFVGVPYEVRLHARGGSGATRWDVVEGELPEGVALDGERLVGEPQRSGRHAVTLRVSDESGAEVVAPGLVIDVGVLQPDGALRLVTTDLPPAFVGVPYAATLSAAGGWPPYQVAVLRGLPAWVAFAQGKLSGIPHGEGASEIEVEIVDRGGRRQATRLLLSVASPPQVRNEAAGGLAQCDAAFVESGVGDARP